MIGLALAAVLSWQWFEPDVGLRIGGSDIFTAIPIALAVASSWAQWKPSGKGVGPGRTNYPKRVLFSTCFIPPLRGNQGGAAGSRFERRRISVAFEAHGTGVGIG